MKLKDLLKKAVQTQPRNLSADEIELFEERAAIMEFDGGLSREDAEEAAMKIIAKGCINENI